VTKRFRLDQTRQQGEFMYQVVREGTRWRAREYTRSGDGKRAYLTVTVGMDSHEDAMEMVALWRFRRMQSAIIGFRCG
jgi:hypothetical protein